MLRPLFSVLLLLASVWAHGAPIPVRLCPDGTSQAPVSDYPAKCPSRLTPTSASAVQATTATAGASTDKQTGTAYVYYSTSATPPYWRTIKSGAGALFAGSVAVTGPSFSVAATGLTAATATYAHIVHEATTGYPSKTSTVAFTTLAAPGGGGGPSDPVVGYFVSTSGSDANPGTSGSPFRTLVPVHNLSSATTPGTDVNILAGTDIAPRLGGYKIPWGGTSTDMAAIRCYYVDTGNSNQLTDCRYGTLGGLKNLYTGLMGSRSPWYVYGSLNAANVLAGTQDFSYPRSDCYNEYGSLLRISKPYTEVSGGKLQESACLGMEVYADGVPYALQEDTLRHVWVKDFEIYNIANNGLHTAFGVKYLVVQRVLAQRYAMCGAWRSAGRSTTPTSKLSFNSGGTTAPTIGQVVTVSGGGSARLDGITLSSGSWAGGNAAGTLWFHNLSGNFGQSSSVALNQSGNADFATATSTASESYGGAWCGYGQGWPAGINISWSRKAYSMVDSVRAVDTWGETSNFWVATHGLYRRSTFGNGLSNGTYCSSGSDCIVERNRYWGSRQQIGVPSDSDFGGNAIMGYEDNDPYHGGGNLRHIMRNNVFFGVNSPLGIQYQSKYVTGGATPAASSGWWLNNSLVAPQGGTIDMAQTGPIDSSLYMQNNVIAGKGGSGYNWSYPSWALPVYTGGNCKSGMTTGYNAWLTIGSGSGFLNCTGANDVGRSGGVTQSVDVKLVRTPNTTGNMDFYKATNYTNEPVATDAAPTADSPLRNAGNPSWTTTKIISDADAAEWSVVLYPHTEIDDAAKLLKWQYGARYDYNGCERDTVSPDVGAIEYGCTP